MFIRYVLAPVDFSPRSRDALAYAFELAAGSGAALEVMHVVPGPGQLRSAVDGYLGRPLPHTSELAVAQAREELQQFVETVAHRHVVPHLVVETGDAASAIVRRAAESPVDLIVIATRGHRGMAELLLGSVAHKVITCARCPVLTLSHPR